MGERGKPEGRGRGSGAGLGLSLVCPAVQSRLERLRAKGERLVKEVEDMYDMAILRLPVQIREMNWIEYFGTGRGTGLAGAPGWRGHRFPAAMRNNKN